MGFISTIMGFCGFGVGISAGLVIGYYMFIYFQPTDVKVLFCFCLPLLLISLAKTAMIYACFASRFSSVSTSNLRNSSVISILCFVVFGRFTIILEFEFFLGVKRNVYAVASS